jgi:hypothetical protein
MKKRLGLPELENAEKQGKTTYLRLLRDEVIMGKIKFLKGSTEDLETEWQSLQWKNKEKEEEDPRCQNHLSDSTLYGWRETFALRASPEKTIPKETDPEYEVYLEEKEEQQAIDELDSEQDIYGSEETDYFDVG